MTLLFNVQVRNLGKPVELAGQYYKDGADEVCLTTFYFQSDVITFSSV